MVSGLILCKPSERHDLKSQNHNGRRSDISCKSESFQNRG